MLGVEPYGELPKSGPQARAWAPQVVGMSSLLPYRFGLYMCILLLLSRIDISIHISAEEKIKRSHVSLYAVMVVMWLCSIHSLLTKVKDMRV